MLKRAMGIFVKNEKKKKLSIKYCAIRKLIRNWHEAPNENEKEKI